MQHIENVLENQTETHSQKSIIAHHREIFSQDSYNKTTTSSWSCQSKTSGYAQSLCVVAETQSCDIRGKTSSIKMTSNWMFRHNEIKLTQDCLLSVLLFWMCNWLAVCVVSVNRSQLTNCIRLWLLKPRLFQSTGLHHGNRCVWAAAIDLAPPGIRVRASSYRCGKSVEPVDTRSPCVLFSPV